MVLLLTKANKKLVAICLGNVCSMEESPVSGCETRIRTADQNYIDVEETFQKVYGMATEPKNYKRFT